MWQAHDDETDVLHGLLGYASPVHHGQAADRPRIAVLIPCYNEEATIAKVVADFRRELPSADVVVFDNNSTDNTGLVASAAGARVFFERHQGKGFVVAAMARQVEADVYVLVDGDDTYPAPCVHDLIVPVLNQQADMVVGCRQVGSERLAYRRFHRLGNRVVTGWVNWLFGSRLCDVMSGFRCFSPELLQRIPIVSSGFEIETELTVQALYRRMIIREVPIPYRARPAGSYSKLSTFRDGLRIVTKIIKLFRVYRPLLFFSLIASLFAGLGLALGAVPVVEFLFTGRILHLPTAVLAAALEIVAVACLTCGFILDSINHHFTEISQLLYQQGVRYDSDHGQVDHRETQRSEPVSPSAAAGIPRG